MKLRLISAKSKKTVSFCFLFGGSIFSRVALKTKGKMSRKFCSGILTNLWSHKKSGLPGMTTFLSSCVKSSFPSALIQRRLFHSNNNNCSFSPLTTTIHVSTKNTFSIRPNYCNSTFFCTIIRFTSSQNVTAKKRTKRKTGTKVILDEFGVRGYDHQYDEMTYPVVAYATCDELTLEKLKKGLLEQGLYHPTQWSDELSMSDVIHATAKYSIGDEPREIFFFREGAVVFWNISDLERYNVLKFMKSYQTESYASAEVMQESEYMLYANQDNVSTRLSNNGRILLNPDQEDKILVKYTFSNAMALSVKLGVWESTLDSFVESIEHISEALKRATAVNLTRAEVLQKAGELFALRHQLNLNSDLLDTPDFYWERERLETLYQKTINYLSINRRTNVMNEKLNQCYELLELILSHLNDKHHIRLEWLIIILIAIEVGFEILHVVERYSLHT